ncbi:MAG: carbamate kinase [Streptosporangiales bacterium]|nr:carbamate kinase [Streptosporangiales bacterium]
MTGPDGTAAPEAQRFAVQTAMERVADLVVSGAEVVLTHGNGPQVGELLVKNQLAAQVVPQQPLDLCDAQTQATIGTLIQGALERSLAVRGIDRRVAVLVTRTRVDPDDPGFARPTKPIGRYLPEHAARRYVEQGETWADFGAPGWRRVVASPEPLEVVDASAAEALAAAGFLVVAAGGGGIPVVRESGGALRGVEAVVDKDLAAAVLAPVVGVSTMVIATTVEHAMVRYGRPDAWPIERVTVGELRALAAAGHFAGGSMGPKVDAAIRFVEQGGRRAAITSLELIADAAAGKAGTVVEPDPA